MRSEPGCMSQLISFSAHEYYYMIALCKVVKIVLLVSSLFPFFGLVV